MKKLNLFIAVTLVAVSSIFTSCKKDDTVTNFPTIDNFTANKTTVTESGDTVTIAIKVSPGDKNIKYITILSSKTGGAAYDVALGKSWTGDKTAAGYWDKDGIYTTTATFIVPDGGATYTCTAYDTEGNAGTASKSQTITIAATPAPVSPAFSGSTYSTEQTGKTIACYLAGDADNGSCYANINHAVYSPANATNVSADIDFIYFNKSNSSFGIYAPSYFGSVQTSAAIAQWATRNKTTFVDVTGKLDYTNATVADVTSYAASAQNNYVTGLAKGSVVVFKTASTSTSASKIGIFTVTDITSGSGSNDKVTVSIRLQK